MRSVAAGSRTRRPSAAWDFHELSKALFLKMSLKAFKVDYYDFLSPFI